MFDIREERRGSVLLLWAQEDLGRIESTDEIFKEYAFEEWSALLLICRFYGRQMIYAVVRPTVSDGRLSGAAIRLRSSTVNANAKGNRLTIGPCSGNDLEAEEQERILTALCDLLRA